MGRCDYCQGQGYRYKVMGAPVSDSVLNQMRETGQLT